MELKVVAEIYEAPSSAIIVPENRVRKEFDRKKLMRLAESFARVGQNTPGVCVQFRCLCGNGLNHSRVAVTDVADVVHKIEVCLTIRCVEILPATSFNTKGLVVTQRK